MYLIHEGKASISDSHKSATLKNFGRYSLTILGQISMFKSLQSNPERGGHCSPFLFLFSETQKYMKVMSSEILAVLEYGERKGHQPRGHDRHD